MEHTPATHVIFGAGPIGTHLARRLVAANESVRIVTRRGTSVPGAVGISADATDITAATRAAEGASVIYNCTNAEYTRWPELLPPLYQGILAVVERTGARYVVTDNLYMYGQANGRMTEETPNGATDSKGQLRARLADDVLEAHTAGRVRASILRASDFYGPDFENGLLSIKAIRAILSGKPVQVLGDPDRLHTFSFVPDVARALAILGANPHGDGQIWHVPSPVALTTRATLELAAQIAGKPLRLKVARRGLLTVLGIAMPLMRELTKTLYQWENDYVMDSSKFEAAFGMHATSLEDGLRSTVNWTEKNSNAAPVVIQRAV